MSKNASKSTHTHARGRAAGRPRDIDAKGWRDIALRVKEEVNKDNVGLIAAGVAFYFLLAIFPMIAAFLSIYGLIFDPAEAQEQITALAGMMPEQARDLLTGQTEQLTNSSDSALGLGVVVGILVSLWSARRGTTAMTIALNIVYEEEDNRNFIRQLALNLILTLGLIIFFALALAIIAVAPVVLEMLSLGAIAETVLNVLRWSVLGVLAVLALAVMYRFCPDRNRARWRWLTPGAVLAVVVWLVASALFSWYVSSFGNYNETYGAVAAVIVLLFWFYLTAYIFLLGAELNAEMEHQTSRDTTTGEEQPMGKRDAFVADDLGREP